MTSVRIDATPYVRSHGAYPRGRGAWAFTFRAPGGAGCRCAQRLPCAERQLTCDCGCPLCGLYWVYGETFTVARRAAVARARDLGAHVVEVRP